MRSTWTKAQMAKADLQAKEAAVANAELQLSYTEIKAPISGRTGQRLLHEGALVKANDNNFTLVTINQLSPIAVAYAVPEGALDEIRRAAAENRTSVTVTDRATGIKRQNGRLEFIDNTVDGDHSGHDHAQGDLRQHRPGALARPLRVRIGHADRRRRRRHRRASARRAEQPRPAPRSSC